MKQYFITEAYTNNYHIVRVNNGKIECDDIVAYYEMEGYCSALESFDYKRAEYVPALEEEVKRAEEALRDAQQALERAKQNPLKISEHDAKKYFEKNQY